MNKRITAFLLALIMLCTSVLSSCKYSCETSGHEFENGVCKHCGEFESIGGGGGASSEEKVFEKSGFDLVKDGDSEYVIIIPENADKNLNFASSEITNFIKQSSGVELVTVTDANLPHGSKYISLGNTVQSEETDIDVTMTFGETGYILKTIDGNIYIEANTTYGVLFATYDLLKYLIDLEIYAEDEFDYEELSTIPVYKFDETFVPLIDHRQVTYKSLDNSYIYRVRMRMQNQPEEWISWCHTTISVYLPTSKYYAQHPEWYNAMQDQLCYSNEEMRKEFVAQMKEKIDAHPNRQYLSIGQEDNLNYCECAKCMEYINSHGGIEGGGFSMLQLEFVNKCAEEVDKWLEVAHPESKIQYVCFAYQTTEPAPVKYDAASGKYVPITDDIRIYKNSYVLFCPIYADFSVSMKDEINYSTYNNMQKWNDLLEYCGTPDNLMIYTYCVPSKALLIPFPNFGMSSDNYNTFREMGATFIYDQNHGASGTPAFEALKIYTQSKAFLYPEINYNELVEDFINHYYGEAREPMWEYYNSLRSWLLYLQQNMSYSGKISFNTQQKDFWPVDVLQKFLAYIDEGLQAIEPLKETDPDRYTTLYDRLNREKIFPIWLMFTFYQDYMDRDMQMEYINILEVYTVKYLITQSSEGNANVAAIIAGWKSAIGK